MGQVYNTGLEQNELKLDELIALLRRASCVEEIDEKRSEIAELMPQVSIMFDYDQQNGYTINTIFGCIAYILWLIFQEI